MVTRNLTELNQDVLPVRVVVPTEPAAQGLEQKAVDQKREAPESNVASDESGKQFISNQVIIQFKIGTPLAEIQRVFENISARELQHFTDSPLFLLEVPDTGAGREAVQIVAKLQGDPRIEFVGLNYLTKPSSAEPAP